MLTPDPLRWITIRLFQIALYIVNDHPITIVPQIIEDIKNLTVESVESHIER
jgi:hypothetical protein